MKKNKLYTFVALALMLGTTSCGDSFLTEEPSSKLPLDGYYNSEARCLQLLLTILCNGSIILAVGLR